jgi:hypothetical protein
VRAVLAVNKIYKSSLETISAVKEALLIFVAM